MKTGYITVNPPPTPPTAVFTGVPVTGYAPLGVTFTDSSTGTSLTNWRWDFGDGNVTNYAVRTHPYHIYTSAGVKSINLTVTGSEGTDSEVKTGYITVNPPPTPPTAVFTGAPVLGNAPLGVTFTDSSTGTLLTNWRWDFGDGNVTNYAVRTHPYHLYTTAGLKSINLTVTGAGGTDSEVKTGYINVTAPPAPPTAAFSGAPVLGTAPLGVTFTDSSTGTSLTNWRWDFGDGNISNYAVRTHPYHLYTTPGLKSINLTVTGTEGTDSEVKVNYIEVTAQEADYSATPVAGVAPLLVMFSDNSTGSSITKWHWDFGDGNISEYRVRTDPLHIYTSPGTYTLNLTVTTTEGSDIEIKTDYIDVAAPVIPPLAAFTGTPVTGDAPLGVTFTDSSTGTSLTNWRWDFGDGNITNYSVRTHPYHIYTSAGLKSINLTVTGTVGLTAK